MMSMWFRGLSCLLLLFLLNFSSAAEEDTVVVTSSGPIRGKRIMTASGMVTAFLGIPYAEPPVGKLRFQKPHPHQSWTHILEATNFGNTCYQETSESSSYHEELYSETTLPLSEDCLFLNVWVPHPRPSAPASVLVWIHGGGFFSGTGSLDRSFLAATENIIVASMNYRLGALGFLSLPPNAPGNAGLWDQNMALSWLKENIAAFGGDPARLTLGGQSAGAASVNFHLLSPASQYVFAQATIQSGAALCPWAWVSPEEAKVRGRTLGRILDCAEKDDRTLVSCLQMKDPGEIMQKLPIIKHKSLLDISFVPTTDGDFLLDDPQNLLEAGNFQVKPILVGFTSEEGSLFLANNAPGFSLYNDSLINQEQLLEGLHLLAPEASESAIEAAALIYSQGEEGEAQYRNALVKASGDYAFLCPVAKVASQMAKAGSSIFAYFFTHRPSFFAAPAWIGVPHCAELPYLFGDPLSMAGDNITYPEFEQVLSQRVMWYWGEFIRTGSPDGENGTLWPIFMGQNFFRINTDLTPSKGMSPTRYCDFWELLATEEPKGFGLVA
ncbi:cholinesterase-like [Hemicordylus capensis]|uniref:cholinesterase-like n=1 Tax=Hemicordylus capensis TaxID=884348 RepID=UPI002303BBAF|nr:cholinesterase-like [Hemicordylus capensis]XP_053148720.1 cholinesterase-like [Hemicordylus capensis]XP_053148721.1 cholinesterase-like [Hemicordylus capensis]